MSVVQDFGSELLMVADDQRAARDWDFDFKSRMAAANPTLIPTLFPEDKKRKSKDRVEEIIEGGQWQQVEWKSPAEVGISEYEKVMAEVAGLTSLTMTADEVDGGGWV